MVIELKKSGNSTSLRIPPEILKQLSINVGDKLNMTVIDGVIHIEKIAGVRDGWFDNINPISADNEAEQMNSDFGCCDFDGLGDAPKW